MKVKHKYAGWTLEAWKNWYQSWVKEGFDKLGAKTREWDQEDFARGGD